MKIITIIVTNYYSYLENTFLYTIFKFCVSNNYIKTVSKYVLVQQQSDLLFLIDDRRQRIKLLCRNFKVVI